MAPNHPLKGSAASGHPKTTAAASEILRAGGNAFDAVVAAGFAAAVAEPGLTSLGGGGFLLARTAQGRAVLFDFFVDTPGQGLQADLLEPHFYPVTIRFPASEQIFNVGMGSVAVPGVLRGYLHTHQRLGRLPLREVLTPAIELARKGVTINAAQAHILELLEPIMTLNAAGRALFAPEGHYLGEGDRFSNPQLAAFLETLPNDSDHEFYQGVLAHRLAQDMRAGHGLLTTDDLAQYQIIEREPLPMKYRGFQLLTNPAPSFGGSLIALSLRLMEARELSTLDFGSPKHVMLLSAVMDEVSRRRAEGHLSLTDLGQPGINDSMERVRRTASGGTTHISVCDAEGNAASMTTSNGEGSGYIVPETGIMLNNMMGEDDLHPEGFHASPPGMRVASMMAPSMLLDGTRLKLILGSGGSKRIRTAMVQVISNMVDFGINLHDAVNAPRLHWDNEHMQVEPGFSKAALAALEKHWSLNHWSVQNVYFGGVNAVTPEGEGVGDSRRGGSAICIAAS
ncbi:MAG: gamma-glutamyltransferase [Candidatus Contendobacter odensis]|uniref:Gamma-glutamyltransferase n=1 Tax=Candidatus Contendibacter odensensis TaxID=1400860 RepID=A0A2G6PGA0_9GAMM|nr:MAG: gamma-glutamyltransferase [Candidatus Contendobacter odensis]